MKENNAILTTHDLAVGYRNGKQQVTLLSGLDLVMEKGKLVALLGQNGAGKSTLLRALTCDERPLNGAIEVNGKDLLTMSQKDRSRLIGLVSTERIQAGALTVRELVGLGRQPHTGFLGRLDDEDRAIIQQAMIDSGIIDEVKEKIRAIRKPRGVSIRKGVIYEGELSPTVKRSGYFDALVDIDGFLRD